MESPHHPRKLVGLLCVFLLTGASLSYAECVFSESFESGNLSRWDIQRDHTDASVNIVGGGHAGGKALCIDKMDDVGSVTVAATATVNGLTNYEISAGIRSERVGFNAQYFIMITQLSKGSAVGANQFLYFDDGRTNGTTTQGTPVTLGQWVTTRHLIHTGTGVDSLRLTFYVGGGRQKIDIDNVSVDSLSSNVTTLPPSDVFSKLVERVEDVLDLDMLVPGFTYELEANVVDGKSDSLPVDIQGMGVNLIFYGLHGEIIDKQRPLNMQADKGIVRTEFVVPDLAMSCRMELVNSDNRWKMNDTSRYPRVWKDVRLFELRGDLTVDALVYDHYTSRPNLAKNDQQPASGFPPVQLNEGNLAWLKQHLAQRMPVDAEVKLQNGGMVILLNHVPQVPFISGAPQMPGPQYNRHELLTQRGAIIVEAPLGVGGMMNQWVDEKHYDFSEVDDAIYENLLKSPDAYVYLYLMSMITPPWWGEKHPDSVIHMDDGKMLLVEGPSYYGPRLINEQPDSFKDVDAMNSNASSFYRAYGSRYEFTYAPSFASDQFREDGANYLRALARHIQTQPYNGAVIGIHLLCGFDGQWNWTDYAPGGGAGPNDKVPDYSPAMVSRFRSFLREKYKSDQAIQEAWKDPNVRLETATIPSQSRRETMQDYLNPEKDRAVIDYNTVKALCPAETLLAFGRAFKESFSRKVLVGAYYSDIAILSAGGPSQNGQRELLQSKDIDIFTGPAYEGRSLGMSGAFTFMTDSYRLHDKLIINELDHRPFTVLNRAFSGNEVFDTAFKSVSVYQREFMAMICRGTGAWNLDMGVGWLDAPLLLENWQELFHIYQNALNYDRSSIARMAVFAGYETKNYQGTLFRGGYPQSLMQSQRVKWNQAGVPIDQYLLCDLPNLKRDYDIYIFMMTAYMRADERQAIEKLKRDGKVLVFYNASGLIDESSASVEKMSALIGMEIAQTTKPLVSATIVGPIAAMSSGMPKYLGALDYEHDVKAPFFYVEDKNAKPIALYDDNSVAVAIKENKDWTSVFYAPTGLIPEEFYRNLARLKGLPIYSEEGDAMYFCKSYVGIHASSEGTKHIHFPKVSHIKELLSGTDYGNIADVVLNMKIGQNAFFQVDQNGTTASQ